MLGPCLNDPSERVRYVAALAIAESKLPEKTADLDSAIARAIGKQSPAVKIPLAWALWKVTKNSKEAVKLLRDGRRNDDVEVRRDACTLLGRIGLPAKSAADQLRSLAEADPDEEVRSLAKGALKAIRSEE